MGTTSTEGLDPKPIGRGPRRRKRRRVPAPLYERLLPILGWLGRYDRRDLPADLVAGAVTAVMLVPQSMAYALLAGLPPVVGLYASTVPLVVYALFGSSRQLAVGPVAIVSLMTLAAVAPFAEPGSPDFVALATLLMLMVGVLQTVLGLIRAGFLVNFLSHAVISGFTSAAALVIGLSQLKYLLAIDLSREPNAFVLFGEVLRQIPQIHLPTLAIGLVTMAALIVGKRWSKRFPTPLLVVVLGSLAAWGWDLQAHGVAIVGAVPRGLPSFAVPAIDVATVRELLPIAATLAFVAYMESVAVAKAIATKHRYKIDADRELVGLGLANVVGAFFKGYPVAGGFGRSAVHDQAGARTPLAGIVTATLIAVTLALFTGAFTYLPRAVLAAIVIVAVLGLVDLREPRYLWRVRKVDAATLAVTFVATLVWGVEPGIFAGIGMSLLVFVGRSAWPHRAELGWLPEEGVFRNVLRFPHAVTWPTAYVARPDAALYFANMAVLEDDLADVVADRPELRHVILDFSGVNDVDGVAVETLQQRIDALAGQGIDVHLAGVKGPVRDTFERAGWTERYGPRVAHLSVAHAARALGLPLASSRAT